MDGGSSVLMNSRSMADKSRGNAAPAVTPGVPGGR